MKTIVFNWRTLFHIHIRSFTHILPLLKSYFSTFSVFFSLLPTYSLLLSLLHSYSLSHSFLYFFSVLFHLIFYHSIQAYVFCVQKKRALCGLCSCISYIQHFFLNTNKTITGKIWVGNLCYCYANIHFDSTTTACMHIHAQTCTHNHCIYNNWMSECMKELVSERVNVLQRNN